MGSIFRDFVAVCALLAQVSAHAASVQVPDNKPSLGNYQTSRQVYTLPDLTLTSAESQAVRLRELLDGDRPVILNFVYASCTTICPILTATFAKAYQLLTASGDPVQFVSVSIDPEQDTPEQLKKYAARYKAGPNWHFLTGDVQSIETVQKTFGTFRGNKANHPSVIFMHAQRGGPWARLEGAIPAAAVVEEYRNLRAFHDAKPQ